MKMSGESLNDANPGVPLGDELATIMRRLPQRDIQVISDATRAERLHSALRAKVDKFHQVGPVLVKDTNEPRTGVVYSDDHDSLALISQLRSELRWKKQDRQVHPAIANAARQERKQRVLASSALTGMVPAGVYDFLANGHIASGVAAVIGVGALSIRAALHSAKDYDAERAVMGAIDAIDGTFISDSLKIEDQYFEAEGELSLGEMRYVKKMISGSYYPLNKDYYLAINTPVNRAVTDMLAADDDPHELWHERLQEAVQTFSELDDELARIRAAKMRYAERASFTKISDATEEAELERRLTEAETNLKDEFLETVRYAYPRWREQTVRKEIDEILSDELHTAAEDGQHSNVLSAFYNVVFDISLTLTDENKQGGADIQAMHDYVKKMAKLIDDERQTKQFYDGFVQRFAESIDVPTWDEFHVRYIAAPGSDKLV